MTSLCEELHQMSSELQHFDFPFNTEKIPLNGIYLLFEKDEIGHGTNRIVRVGTHTGNNNLRSRLKEHFINENKDRSIFRKNIGRALINKTGDKSFLSDWELDLTESTKRKKYVIDYERITQLERDITNYIQSNFQFVVLQIDEKSKRLKLESKIISTISWCVNCFPSSKWLGQYSTKQKIKQSGLWLVNGLFKEPLNEEELNYLFIR